MLPAGTLDLFAELVALDTTSARSNLPAAELAGDRLDAARRRVRIHPSPDGGTANLTAVFGPPVDPERRDGLLLSGHMDVVPAGEPDWSSDPFPLTDRGDRWIGRGTCDMKGFLALAADARRRDADPAVCARRSPCSSPTTRRSARWARGDFVEPPRRGEPLPRATVIGEPTSLRGGPPAQGAPQAPRHRSPGAPPTAATRTSARTRSSRPAR